MVYLYIDIEGRVGKATTEPTDEDIACVRDGQLTVIRIEQDQFGNVFPEEMDPAMDSEPWFDVSSADIEEEEGRKYHVVCN